MLLEVLSEWQISVPSWGRCRTRRFPLSCSRRMRSGGLAIRCGAGAPISGPSFRPRNGRPRS